MKKLLIKSILIQLSIVVMLFGVVAISPDAQAANCMTNQQCTDLGETNNTRVKFSLRAEGCGGDTGVCEAVLDDIRLNVPIGGLSSVSGVEKYIELLFRFLVGAAGVVAVVMLVLGGYTYITAAGNQARVSRAKDFIVNALVGLVMVFGSVVFLGTLNERLVDSGPFRVELVNPQDIVEGKFCENPSGGAKCGEMTSEASGGALCRSGACGGGQVCLPVSIGGINNVTAYKCYESSLDALSIACQSAPPEHCETVSDAMMDATGNANGCGTDGSECMPGPVISSCDENFVRQNCDICGGYKMPDDEDWGVGSDEYYCRDLNTQQFAWHIDNMIGPDTLGAICCKRGDDFNDVELWTGSDDCDVDYENNAPKAFCEDFPI